MVNKIFFGKINFINIINGDIQKLIDELKLYQNTQQLKEAGEIL